MISLFKDTSLVTIVSLYELTGALSLALLPFVAASLIGRSRAKNESPASRTWGGKTASCRQNRL